MGRRVCTEISICKISLVWYTTSDIVIAHTCPRAREKQQCQNSRAYQKKHSRHHASKTSLPSDQPQFSAVVPSLPSSLVSLTAVPLPTSDLFCEALHSADLLDESDLYLWEQEPPYDYPEPFMTAQEVRYTKNLVDVLLGQRWRLAKAIKDDRTLRFANGKVQELMDEIVEGLAVHIHRWSMVASCITEVEANRNMVMADCWLHWQAQEIFTDIEEVKALKNGENPYCT